jgi:protein-S-isoprenylcysteine O-methyltransferase Ste14
MEGALRWLLPIYLVLYLSSAFVWRSYLVWRRTGVNPYALRRTDSTHDYVGMLFRFSIGADVVIVLIYALSSELYTYLTPILWLQSPAIVWTGIILMAISLVVVIMAQAQMGNSWRIGIDTSNKTELVQQGIFNRTRNPIFLGMRLTQLGLFLVLPSAATFATLILGDALIQIQVRLEEEYLAAAHGADYQNYRLRVRRWI